MEPKVSFKRFVGAWVSVLMWAATVYMLMHGDHRALFATITFGDTSAPSDIAKYFDSLFTQSLPFIKKTLTDNISADNAILDAIMSSDSYRSYAGGTDIEVPLMYGLPEMDWYDGFDELPDGDTDGVSTAVYQAVQGAMPVQYSMKDIIRNKNKIMDFAKTKLKQAQGGSSESFAKALILGAAEGALATPKTGTSGASAISPIHKLIPLDPTASVLVGNINQSTSSWWRSRVKSSTSSTYTDLLFEAEDLFNTCSLGTGGSPKLFLVDQFTYQAMNRALYVKYRQVNSDQSFKFTNTKLPFGNGQCRMVMDEKMPDVENGLWPTVVGGTGLTVGSGLFVNTDFLELYYIEGRDFEMLVDENGKTFAKPIKGDSRLGHIGWMGELTTSQRRKHGLLYGVARSFTNS